MAALSRLSRKHGSKKDFVVDASERLPGNWHPTRDLEHYMKHQNSLKSFA